MNRRGSALFAGIAALVLALCGFTIALPLLGAGTQDTCLPVVAVSATPSTSVSQTIAPASNPPGVSPNPLPTLDSRCDSVIKRARIWLTAWHGGPVPYMVSNNPQDLYDGYRRDCSGFASMALGLPGPGLDSGALAARSQPLMKSDLRAGDLLINPAPGGAGHVVIFEQWTDATMTSYMGYEQSGDGGTHHRQIPFPYFHGYQMAPFRWPTT
jgi:hypothetical protein